MDIQLSLFNINNDFESTINNLFQNIIKECELPKNSLQIAKLESKANLKSIRICEPEYPPIPNKSIAFTIKPILKIEHGDYIDLSVRDTQYNILSKPTGAKIKKLESEIDFIHVIFNSNDSSVYEYIKEIILYNIKIYSPSTSFGCCSKYIQCSDLLKCVHENKLYSKGCGYRINLENGKIFYGKNINI